ncbi:cucumisin-like [Henckelia pumila]|uniref:cucumisin-like n=1 Tax=Henckelia pumila TaxID=405737 RepID=UPI003C6DC367
MGSPTSLAWPLLITLFYSVLLIACNAAKDGDQKVYIVYMGDLPKGELSAAAHHLSMLQSIMGRPASESWLYSYRRSFNGFVAKLTVEEKNKIASLDGVVSVFASMKKQLHTSRSWDFLGFPETSPRSAKESDVIVGMLDTGIWPESASFDDKGLSPPPSKWKGSCQSSSNFTCNNKIIGAKYYHSEGAISPPDIPSPRDSEGHGSHTASTATGDSVAGASLYGLGSGTVRGAAPSARLAVYKICWSDGCSDADILAAFDDAIADGVDVISISVGGFFPSDYFEDPIAIGAYHAMKNGVLTSNSAGNSGPDPESIVNFSPWSLSVAANVIDRKFLAKVQLGNGKTYEGVSVNTFDLEGSSYPLTYGGGCDSLDPEAVKGTVVLCDVLNDSEPAAGANATGTIMQDDGFKDYAFSFPISASYLGSSDGAEVFQYFNSTSKPIATIFKSASVNETLAPFVVSFSSRGPNPITKGIMKPDLSAPGVDILAAWSEATTVTGSPEDTRVVPYNIISGTSMSCPHASGAAAYVKSFNPTWSPSAIKSALMTTATPLSVKTNTDAEFAYGSGQINPLQAKSPGLIYDLAESDYISFLCGQGYSSKNLKLITGENITCSSAKNATVYDLNYPSFAPFATSGTSASGTFHRTVTNVGSATSTYTSIVLAPSGVRITVEPSTLTFESLGEKKTFVVTVTATIGDSVQSGSLVWYDGVHRVRSPIVVPASDS